MSYLILSLGIFLVVPALYWPVSRLPILEKFFKYLAFAYIFFAIVMHIIPEGLELAGENRNSVGAVFILGLVLFTFMEKLFHLHLVQNNRWGLMIFGGLMLAHTALDGLSVHIGEHGDHHHMGMAVVLHRLPIALFLWGILRQRYSFRQCYGLMLAGAASTLLGYLSPQIGPVGKIIETNLIYVQAFLVGGLTHVIVASLLNKLGLTKHSCS